MAIPLKKAPTEQLHLLNGIRHRISNPNQPTGKYRWLVASVTSFIGTGGVVYVSVIVLCREP